MKNEDRDFIFHEIVREREYQDSKYGQEHDDNNTIKEILNTYFELEW